MTVVDDRAAVAAALTYRPVTPEELTTCAGIWRDGINDYVRRLNQPDVPEEFAPLVRLYAHLQGTDPERFIAATDGDGRLVAFASAVVRERLWFLSMCFVLPEVQGAGVGRSLVARLLPAERDGMVCGTATDSAQPISNALYGTFGIVPRVPLLNLVGEAGHATLSDAVDALDREVLGVAHPVDHRFLRQEGRHGWLYLGPDGVALGYGYAGEAGRVGPVAVRDEALLGPVLGHLMTAVVPRGAFALWLPGTADRALVPALQAGFRMDQVPILLCWDRPFADLARYLPISPGLL